MINVINGATYLSCNFVELWRSTKFTFPIFPFLSQYDAHHFLKAEKVVGIAGLKKRENRKAEDQ
jgi:hypothetical protein